VKKLLILPLLAILIAACSPEVGSEAWCEDMKQKPRGEWTVNEAGDFTRHCIF
jgi:hypothetical protein